MQRATRCASLFGSFVEILVLSALILINGLFAMSEIALVTARRARLQKLVEEGDAAAAAAVKLGEDPTRFLSTIQIGITSIGVLNGIVGEAALAAPLAAWLAELGLPAPYSGYGATGLVVVLITYFSIVVGELVPKRLGQTHPEMLARLVARPIDWLAVATKPFVRLLTISTQGLLRMLGVKDGNPNPITAEEIHAMLAEGTKDGVIESHEHDMVRNVFRLDDRQIVSLMVPRGDVATLDVGLTFEQNLQRIEDSDHARFPVVRGGLGEVLGIVNARQWLSRALRDGERDLARETLQEPLYVPETLTGMELLDNFRSTDMQMAFVIDEYGEVQGIVTLQDLIEAITGEFQPRDPQTSWAVQREDGGWLLDGHIPVPELKDRLNLATVPEEERGRYHTLSGMLMLLSGRVPKVADTAEWEGWRLEIVDMDGKTIDKVLAQRLDTVPAPLVTDLATAEPEART
jgi:putative hemolysin